MAELQVQRRVRHPFVAFTDRADAGKQLAAFVGVDSGAKAVVQGLPRGGIPVAAPLAEAIKAPLQPVFARKLPIPSSPEAGFGAVALNGSVSLNQALLGELRLSRGEIECIVREVEDEVQNRARKFGAGDTPRVEGRTVYMVDDGLATGYSMIAAAEMIRRLRPQRMHLCVPVASSSSISAVEPYFDEIACLLVQESLPFAVASFYADFHDLSDEEVQDILRKHQAV